MSSLRNYLKQKPTWVKFAVIFMILAVILVSIGNRLTRNYLQGKSEELIGRKVTLGSIRINPLTASLAIHDMSIYEKDSDTVFFSFDRFYVNISPWAYFFNDRVVITEVELSAPSVRIVMNKTSFNFDDLIERFAKPKDSVNVEVQDKEPILFTVEKISLTRGGLKFNNETFGGSMGLDSIHFACPEIASDKSGVDFDFGIAMSSGGNLNLNGSFDKDSLSYAITVNGHAFDIGFLLPFVDKVMYVSGLNGKIDTELHVGGDLKNSVSEAEGFVRLSGFQLLDTLGKPSVALEAFELQIDTISAIEGTYAVHKVSIHKPFLRFDLTTDGNNLIRSIAAPPDSATVLPDSLQAAGAGSGQVEDDYLNFFKLLNDYFYELGRAYAINFYALDSLILDGGNIEFNDYTLNTQFHFLFEDLSITAANVRSDMDSVLVDVHSSLNKSGILDGRTILKPKQVGDMYVHYTLNELKVSDFSPYSEYYVAHPFWDGVVFFESTSEVKDQILDSDNRLIIKNLEVGDKMKGQTVLDLPLKLAVSLLKDVHGDVNLKIPLKGNVNDPKFRITPVVLKIFKDLIIKAVASPYKLLATTFKANPDDLRDIKYDYLQYELRSRQTKSLNLLARILNQKPRMTVELIHLSNPEWEINQYALFEAKKMYYIEVNNKSVLNFDDSVAIDGIQRLDTAFQTFLVNRTGTSAPTEVEQLALEVVGKERTQLLLAEVEAKRKQLAADYLAAKVEGESRFSIVEASPDDAAKHRERPKLVVLFEASDNAPPQ